MASSSPSAWAALLDSATTDSITIPAALGHVVEISSHDTPAHAFQVP